MKFSFGKKTPPVEKKMEDQEGSLADTKRVAPIKAPHPKLSLNKDKAEEKETPLKLDPNKSIDSIISRTKDSSRRFVNRVNTEILDRESALNVAENRLDERFREVRIRESKTQDMERELSEFEMLLEARERALDKKEAAFKTAKALSSTTKIPASESDVSRELEETLKDLEAKYSNSIAKLDDKESQLKKVQEDISLLEKEIHRLQKKEEELSHNATTINESELAQKEKELKEKEALLAEREAFIEESENTLFNKAQEIQELQTHLDHITEDSNE